MRNNHLNYEATGKNIAVYSDILLYNDNTIKGNSVIFQSY